MEEKEHVNQHHNPQHPGFKSVQTRVARHEGVKQQAAAAMVAASARKASPAARKANPRLARVRGK